MHILLIGSGAREHALAKSIKQSPQNPKLFCISTSTNPAIKSLCEQYHIANITDSPAILGFAKIHTIDIAIIGPEAPLEAGIADALKSIGIAVVGPTKNHAQLETSKAFTRDLLHKNNIDGNPFYKEFNTMDGVAETLQAYAERFVIKADGLCGGKGVMVWGDHLHSMEQALEHCQSLTDNGNTFVIEEKLDGQEFSLISFTDGKNFIHMPLVQDHKRAFVGDTGPNTGGMGTYTDSNHLLPFISDTDRKQAESITVDVAKALYDTFGTPYQGILYGGFMATHDSVKVIEYNARFGDPEAMNLLTLLNADFVEIAQGITKGTLDKVKASFKQKASVCKYVVPNGYPDAAEKGFAVDISAIGDDVEIFMSAVDEQNGELIATGSRTIAILALGDTIAAAEKTAQKAVEKIKGNLFHRPDIGTADLINKRIDHMNTLRGDVYKKIG